MRGIFSQTFTDWHCRWDQSAYARLTYAIFQSLHPETPRDFYVNQVLTGHDVFGEHQARYFRGKNACFFGTRNSTIILRLWVSLVEFSQGKSISLRHTDLCLDPCSRMRVTAIVSDLLIRKLDWVGSCIDTWALKHLVSKCLKNIRMHTLLLEESSAKVLARFRRPITEGFSWFILVCNVVFLVQSSLKVEFGVAAMWPRLWLQALALRADFFVTALTLRLWSLIRFYWIRNFPFVLTCVSLTGLRFGFSWDP